MDIMTVHHATNNLTKVFSNILKRFLDIFSDKKNHQELPQQASQGQEMAKLNIHHQQSREQMEKPR